MKLFYDLRLGYFVSAPGVDSELSELYGKAGDTEEVVVQFGRSSDPTGSNSLLDAPVWTAENLAGGTVITIGLKQDGKYSDGTILATTSTFAHNSTDKVYTASFGLNTTAINTALERLDTNAADDIAELDCQFEITFQIGGSGGWRSSVLPVPFTLYHDIIGGSEGTPTNAAEPTQYLLKSAGIEYLPTVTSKTGGTSADLDYIPTVGVTVGKMVAFRDLDSTSIMRIYELSAGTDAESSPDVIRPDDYNASSNAKVWKLQSLSSAATGTNTGDVTLAASVTDVFDIASQVISADDPGADRLIFWDDSAGKLTHLTAGSGLTITGTTITSSGGGSGVTTIGATANDVFSVSGSDLIADDAGADRLIFWDDSESKLTYLAAGSGLSISGTTITATGSGVTAVNSTTADIFSVSGSDLVADDPNADRLVFWDDSASKLTHLTAGGGLNINGTTLTARTLEIGGGITASTSMANNRNRQMIHLDTTSNDVDLTIDPNSTTAYDDYFYCAIMKSSSNNVAQILRGSGVELWYNGTDGDITLSNGVVWTIWREGLNTWRVIAKT